MRLGPGRERRTTLLGAPRRPARLQLQPHYDPEAFGRFSEAIARLLGTARYLVVPDRGGGCRRRMRRR